MTNFSQLIKDKQIEQNRLSMDIEEFLQNGGKITKCPPAGAVPSKKVYDDTLGSLYDD